MPASTTSASTNARILAAEYPEPESESALQAGTVGADRHHLHHLHDAAREPGEGVDQLRRGWVEHDDSGFRFRLGIRALRAGASSVEHDDVVQRAQPVMNDLSDQLGETIHRAAGSGQGEGDRRRAVAAARPHHSLTGA